ncbi:SwmB domain-containing protein, partial [Verminephrobacter aporrectodeae]|uniref:SwmB domain-containing protein n=4 Tax=Verminephrobacter aporrectodeae TaxID=1110389 RepID=UPI0022444A61
MSTTLSPTQLTSITIADSALTADETTTVTLTFDRLVRNVTAANLEVPAGTLLSNMRPVENRPNNLSRIWKVTLTPPADTAQTPQTIRLKNLDGVKDTTNDQPVAAANLGPCEYTVNTQRPTLAGATMVNGALLVLSYTDATSLDATNKPDAEAFTVRGGSGPAIIVSYVRVDATAKTVTLVLARAVRHGELVTVSYTDPTSGNDSNAIQNAAGNDALSFSNQAVTHNTPVDTRPPSISSLYGTIRTDPLSTADIGPFNQACLRIDKPSATVTLKFTQPVKGFSASNVVLRNGAVAISTPTAVNPDAGGHSDTWTFTLSAPAGATDSNGSLPIAVNLSGVTNHDGVQGSATEAYAGVQYTVDVTRPTVTHATVTGNQLVLTWSETLDIRTSLASTAFAVTVDGTARDVSAVAMNYAAKTVTLTLSSPVSRLHEVKVSYTDPSTSDDGIGVVQDRAGNDAASFTQMAVTNNTTASADSTPPALASATVNGNQLVLSYTEANNLDAAALAGNAGFTVSSTGTAITVTGAVVNGAAKTVTLTLSRAVTYGETVSVSYTKPATGAVVQDADGNDAVDFSSQVVRNTTPEDTTPPALSSATVNGDQLVLTWSEALDNVIPATTAFRVSVNGDARGVREVVVNAAAKTVTLTLDSPVTRGDPRVRVSYTDPSANNETTGVIQDRAGNDANSFTNTEVTNNTRVTTVASIACSDRNLAAGESCTYTIVFSAPIKPETFTLPNDLITAHRWQYDEVTGKGELSNLYTTDGGTTWKFTLTAPMSGGESIEYTLILRLDGLTDSVGNPCGDGNLGYVTGGGAYSFAQQSYTIDTTRPTATITLDKSSVNRDQTATVTFSFSESVHEFNERDVVLGDANGTLGPLTAVGSDRKIWTATFTPRTNVNDASNTIRVNLAGVSDLAGNTGAGSASSANYTVDTRGTDTDAPVLRSATVNGNQLVLTYTDEVNNLSAAELSGSAGFTVNSTTGAAITVSSAAVNGVAKTVTLTLSRAVTGSETLSLSYTRPETGRAVQDEVGNLAANFSSQTVTNLTGRPTATITLADTALKAGESTAVTFTFSEPVTDFTAADLVLTDAHGTLGELVRISGTNDGATSWRATYTPAVNTTSPSNAIHVDLTGVRDLDGNTGLGRASSANYTVDTVRPIAVITLANRVFTAGQSTTVTFRFTEAVNGFTADDVILSDANGTLSPLTPVDWAPSGTAWTATFTPTANVRDTSNTIRVNAAGVTDDAGNTGVGIASSDNFTVDTRPADTVAPVFHSATVNGDQLLLRYTEENNLNAAALTGSAGFALSSATGAAISVSSAVVNGVDKTVTLTLSRTVTGSETLSVSYTRPESGNAVQDVAGNAAANLGNQTVTNVTGRPTATITLEDSTLTLGETTTVTFTFSEPVTDFTAADVVLTDAHGTLNELERVSGANGGGTSWRATFTPTANTSSLSSAIHVDLAGVRDLEGNAGVGRASSANYSVVTTRPTATITLDNSAIKHGQSTTVTFRFSEPVTGFTRDDVVLSNANGTLSEELIAGSDGKTWVTTFTPNADVLDTSNTIGVNLSGVSNAAGNAGTGQASSANYTVDTVNTQSVHPSATITFDKTRFIAGESTKVEFLFPWTPVIDFKVSDIDLTQANGTLSNLRAPNIHDGRAGGYWTATFTPNADTSSQTNAIHLKLANLSIIDGGAGRGLASSANYSIDTLRPTVTITLADSSLTAGETTTATFSFSEPVIGFAKDDIMLIDANGSLGALTTEDAGKTWTAPFTPKPHVNDATNTISVNLAGVVDAAGNAGVGTASSANYTVHTRVGDTTAPVFSSATVINRGEQLVLSFTDANSLSDAALTSAGFTVNSSAAGATAITVRSVSVNAPAKTVTLTLSRTVALGEPLTVSYARQTDNVVRDAEDNAAANFRNQPVTNNDNTPDTTPPVLRSAAVNGDQLLLTFSEPLDGSSRPPVLSAFVVSVVGDQLNSYWVRAVAVNGPAGTITLTLAKAVTPGQVVRIGYEAPPGGGNHSSGVIQDVAGNDAATFGGQPVTNTSPPAAGGTRLPTLAATNPITIADNKLSLDESTTVTIRFAEAIATDSFTIADLTVSGGAKLSNLRSTDGGTTWTVTLTAPERSDFSGLSGFGFFAVLGYNSTGNQIRVNLAGVTNLAGNAGVGQAVSTVTYDIDVMAPSVVISLGDTFLTPGETTTVTFSFNEPVTGFDADDIDLTRANGTLGPLTAIGDDSRTWTATFTPAANINDAENKIRVRLNGVADLAGNRWGTNVTSASSNYTIDTRSGTTGQTSGLSASVTLTDDRLTTGEKATVIIAFNKPVNNFALDDVNGGTNGTLSDLVRSADGRTWTATFTPTAGVIAESNIIRVNLAGVTDAAGTAGTGSATSANFIVNTALPAATITLTDTALTTGETTTVTFTFNQSVLGFTIDDVDLTQANGTLSGLTYTANNTWTATFTPDANVSAATNTIRVNLTGVANHAGRSSTGTASSANYTVDTRLPDTTPPAFSSAAVNGSQLVITYTEANSLDPAALAGSAGYAVSSTTGTAITVSGAVVHATNKTVTLTLSRAVTPAETVKVSYTKPASGAVVQDAAGNDAVSFSEQAVTNNTPSGTADTTPPQLITAGHEYQFPTVNRSGEQLLLTFSDTSNLDENHMPAARDFTVRVDGDLRTVSSVTMNATAKIIFLVLATPVAAGQRVTVAYQDSTPTDTEGNGIQDTAGNRLDSFPATEAVNSVLDTGAPQLITTGAKRPTASGNQLVLSFSDANGLSVDPARKPATGDFAVRVAGVANAVTAVTVDGAAKTITLTLTTAVTPGQTATVAYADSTPNDISAIQDAQGNRLTGFAATEVNTTPDTTPPVFSSAAVRGNQLVITYTEADTLDAAALAGSAGFTVSSTTGTAITVSSAVVHATNKTVTLTLSRAVTPAETVKVSYTKPASGAVVQDAAGNDAVSFSEQAVTNNTPSGTADTTAPVLLTTGIHRPELLGGTMLAIRFSDTSNLDADRDHAPAIGDFTVRVNGALRTVSGVAVDGPGKYILLELANPPVVAGQSVTVAYQDSTSTDNKGIQDIHGNRLTSFSATEVVIGATADTGGPELITTGTARPKVNGNQLVLSFIDARSLEANNKPANGAFVVLVNGVANAVTNVTVQAQAKTVTLTLTTAVTHGQSVTVAYTDPTGRDDINAIQDDLGQDAASFAATEVLNNPAADTTPPAFSSATVTGSQLVITYTEAGTLDAAALAGNAGFTVSSTTGTAITVSSAVVHATNKTVTLTLSRAVTPAETVKVSYTKPASGAVVQDAAGNDAVSFSEQAVTNTSPPAGGGTRLPTLAATNPITIADDKLGIGESTTVTIRFAEAIATDSFTTADLIVSGYATLSNLRSTDGGITWTVTLTAPTMQDLFAPEGFGSGKYNSTGNQIRVNLAGVTNLAGNAGVGQAVSTVTYDIDTMAPIAAITLGDTFLTPGETTTVTFSFNEPVTGFDADDIDLTRANGTLGPLTAIGDDRRTWTATFTPAANVNDAENKIRVRLGGVADLAGNSAPDSTSISSNYTIDTRPGSTGQTSGLSASVTLTDVRLTTGEKTTVIIAFNKPVNGFTLDDVDGTRANGTLSGLILSADGRTWTATFTPTAGVIAESNTISVNLAGVTDAAGTAGTGSATSDNFRVHTALPAATITLADTALTTGETTTVTFSFNQMVLGFTIDDIDLTQANGTLSAPTYTANNTWTATFTPEANVSAATNTIRVNLTGVANVAGRSGTGTADSANYTVDTRVPDTTPPQLITTGATSPKVTGDQLVLSFDDTSNLDADPIHKPASGAFTVLVNGVANAVTTVTVQSRAKTVTLTLSTAVTHGQSVTVAYTDPTTGNDTNAIQDYAGNDAASFAATEVTNNTPAPPDTTAPQLIITGDTTRPKVNGDQLVLSFSDTGNLDADPTHKPANGAFTVLVNGVANAVTHVSVEAQAKTVTLTLSTAVTHGQSVTVAYADPTTGNDANAIQDAAGNDVASFAATAVTNNTPAPADTTPPELITTGDTTRPKVTGDQLVLSFNDTGNLDADATHKPAGGAFTVLVNGVANAVTNVSVEAQAKTVTLTLSTAVSHG